jgi:dolichol-phosphate mannosyltransferase
VEGDKLPPRSRVFRLPANYGLGVATLIAADHMIVGGYDVLVRVDADGQHPVAMISRLVARVERGVDLCVGIRTNAGSVSGLRARLAGAVRAYYRVVGGMLVGRLAAADLTSGFMAFSRRAAAAVARWDLDRYPEPEIVLLAHRHGLVIDAVPIEQAERQFGRSTISLRRGVLLFYRFNMFVLGQLLDRVRLK